MASYACERGFELLGPSRRICQADGRWLPEGIPFCGKTIISGFFAALVETNSSNLVQSFTHPKLPKIIL